MAVLNSGQGFPGLLKPRGGEIDVRTYETIFILDPDLPEEEVEKSIRKIESVIESQNGKLVSTERWGKRKLAYRVKKKFKGNYFQMIYYSTGNLVAVLERNLRLMEEVYKFITVKLSDTEIEITDKKEAIDVNEDKNKKHLEEDSPQPKKRAPKSAEESEDAPIKKEPISADTEKE
jgi:small subunit ribosomal protein S6